MDEKTKILVVDDDKEIADLIEIYLTSSGFDIVKAYTAVEGLNILKNEDIKLAIIDVMMPGMNGIQMCKIIREDMNIPIIILSAKSADADKIYGLTVGADDYMTKPFSPMELIARVKSQLRRYLEFTPAKEVKPKMLQIRNVIIDVDKHIVTVDGQNVDLTPIEFGILSLLAMHPGRVYSIDDIYENVWKEKIFEANNTVMVHIRRLREKIEHNPRKPEIIITVWGVGYKVNG